MNVIASKPVRVTQEGNQVLRCGRNRGIILTYERGATREREETKGETLKLVTMRIFGVSRLA